MTVVSDFVRLLVPFKVVPVDAQVPEEPTSLACQCTARSAVLRDSDTVSAHRPRE